jgi:hypothetical protein
MSFDRETRRVIGVAFDMICVALGLSDRRALQTNYLEN